MSNACSCKSAKDFASVWHIDFEYRQDRNHRPLPICLTAIDELSGREIVMWEDELLRSRRPPFGIGSHDLIVAYASNAEAACFLQLGWPLPQRVLDLYVEIIAAINGDDGVMLPDKRPRLDEALELFGLPHEPAEYKDRMRDLILQHDTYTPEQRRQILDYNRKDVEATLALLPLLIPVLDLPRALHRGRYMMATARMEYEGLPVDRAALDRLLDNWTPLLRHYIRAGDSFGLYDDIHFVERRFEELIRAKGWDWPQTPTGKPSKDAKTLGQQAKRYPELKPLVHMRNVIGELRISQLANTVGADSFSRCPLLPFWTKTGRNQPAAREKVFLPALPAWVHGVLRPPEGWALVGLDWRAQEVAVMAGLSHDGNMIDDYASGDPHKLFGIRAGLIDPVDAPEGYAEVRQKICKPITLGQMYGMTPYGIAAKTKRSLLWSQDIYARHRQIYPTFHRWLADRVAQARFDRRIESSFGWPMVVTGNTTRRQLLNYPAQSGGADAMRIATIAATEAGIRVAAPVHDAFWVLAPVDRTQETIEHMRELMTRAGAAVTGGLPIEVEVAAIITPSGPWGPQCKGDVMWNEVHGLLAAGTLSRRAG
jgi:hypothetical protein